MVLIIEPVGGNFCQYRLIDIFHAAGTLYMVQKLLCYTINLGGRNTIQNGQKRLRTDENNLSLVAAP